MSCKKSGLRCISFCRDFNFLRVVSGFVDVSVKCKGMRGNSNSQQFFNRILNFLQTGITKLKNAAILDVDKVVVLFEFKGTLILGAVVAKLVLGYQVAILEQFYGVIESSTANPVLVVLHLNVEGLNVEVAFGCINLSQNSKAFRRFAVLVAFKILGKDLFYGIKIQSIVIPHSSIDWLKYPENEISDENDTKNTTQFQELKSSIKVDKKTLLLFGLNKNK